MCQGLREDEFNTTLNNIKKNYCGLCTNIKKKNSAMINLCTQTNEY